MPSSPSFGRLVIPETQWDPMNSMRKSDWWHYGVESNSLLEWDMYEPRVCVIGTANKPHNYIFKAQVARKYRYFTINVMAATGCISTLAFTAFAVRPATGVTSLIGRLEIIATYLLTMVAFKFVVADSLPKVSYMTVLDRYFTFTMAFIGVLSIAVSVLFVTEARQMIEDVVSATLGLVWIVYHVAFYFSSSRYISTMREILGKEITGKHQYASSGVRQSHRGSILPVPLTSSADVQSMRSRMKGLRRSTSGSL